MLVRSLPIVPLYSLCLSLITERSMSVAVKAVVMSGKKVVVIFSMMVCTAGH